MDSRASQGQNTSRWRSRTACLTVVLTLIAVPARSDDTTLPPPAAGAVDFARDVLPILQRRCVECHGPAKRRGGLRLDDAAAVRKGGDSGAVVLAGESAGSPLIHHVTGLQDAARMPPKGDPLTGREIGVLRAWIDQEKSPAAPATRSPAAVPWALLPLKSPAVPVVPAEHRGWARNSVDAFVLKSLLDKGMQPSPEADRRTLLRRLSVDLTGLPPTFEELDAFLGDTAAGAYERQVDRLLSSPRYGERWARHWLDVVHYADSHGQDQDRPRPNAWPYRDYVIHSFNSDTPYAQFVREQIAGDVLSPDDPRAIRATGFLSAGPWDESGLMGISEDSLDRQVAHYLDRDDMVTTTMSTFAGLTVHCARCHDHKFDPITQEDYYALQAVFAGIDKAERTFDADPAVARKRAELDRQFTCVRGGRGKAEPEWLSPVGQAEAEAIEAAWREAESRWITPEPLSWRSANGAVLKPLLDRSVLSLGTRPDKDTYTVSLGTELVGMTGLRLEVLIDETLPKNGPGRNENGNLHLSEVRMKARPKGTDGPGVPVSLKAAKADFDQNGWGIARAFDGDPATAWGIFPEVGKSHRAVFDFAGPVGFPGGTELTVELDQLHGGGHLIGRFRVMVTTAADPLEAISAPLPAALTDLIAIPKAWRTPIQKAELARTVRERRLERELAGLPSPSRVYCGTNRFAPDGSFRPAATPRPVHVLMRGEITRPGKVAEPGAVAAVPGLEGRFRLTDPNDEGQRRAALAGWMTAPENPLPWRVMVNRVWHYHFGLGIVDTPNDFGKMGGPPSHPELLDWLAAGFRDGGGSVKALHRLIVTSSTYRQSSGHNPVAATKDADNRLLWRMNRVRLDAETVRDAVLLASGRLDDTMDGPPVMHFVMSPGVHVTPVADYERYDVDRPEARRRSIYRYVFRTRPDPLLEALDCPDASQSAPVRSSSVGALQALALWNNKFTLRSSEHLAELAVRSAPDLAGRVRVVSLRVLGRPPTAAEQGEWTAYADRHGLANLGRVLFNSSEFLFVD